MGPPSGGHVREEGGVAQIVLLAVAYELRACSYALSQGGCGPTCER